MYRPHESAPQVDPLPCAVAARPAIFTDNRFDLADFSGLSSDDEPMRLTNASFRDPTNSYEGGIAMQIITTRFGATKIEAEDILLFPHGIVAFEPCRHWVILADSENNSVAWLQSLNRPGLALPVVSPRRYVPDYRVRVSHQDLSALDLLNTDQAYVLAIVGMDEGQLTLNLRAPLIVNLDRRLGRQVVTVDDQPLQLVLAPTLVPLRKSA